MAATMTPPTVSVVVWPSSRGAGEVDSLTGEGDSPTGEKNSLRGEGRARVIYRRASMLVHLRSVCFDAPLLVPVRAEEGARRENSAVGGLAAEGFVLAAGNGDACVDGARLQVYVRVVGRCYSCDVVRSTSSVVVVVVVVVHGDVIISSTTHVGA
eukprot:1184136-Prorocentrum_minimum.AAC.1